MVLPGTLLFSLLLPLKWEEQAIEGAEQSRLTFDAKTGNPHSSWGLATTQGDTGLNIGN